MSKPANRNDIREIGASYLAQRGYDVIEKGWSCGDAEMDYIARDPEDDALAFIKLDIADPGEHRFPKEDLSRKARDSFEKAMLAYVSEHDMGDCDVRYDRMAIYACSNRTACIRHHLNVLEKAA